jgi:hypothetical protein
MIESFDRLAATIEAAQRLEAESGRALWLMACLWTCWQQREGGGYEG